MHAVNNSADLCMVQLHIEILLQYISFNASNCFDLEMTYMN